MATAPAEASTAGPCSVPDSPECIGALDVEESAVQMLQRKAQALAGADLVAGVHEGRRAQAGPEHSNAPNASLVWQQIEGAVDIDELKKELHEVEESAEFKQGVEQARQLKARLQEKLDELVSDFPRWAEVKQRFQDQWDQLKDAVSLDEIKKKIDNWKEGSNEQLDKLREKFERLKERMHDNTDAVKDKVKDTWKKMQDDGVPLPDLQDIADRAKKWADKAKDAWHDFFRGLH